jgi:hypothetical protein
MFCGKELELADTSFVTEIVLKSGQVLGWYSTHIDGVLEFLIKDYVYVY